MKKNHPKVTVIVPNFNHSTYLNPRLESIYHQTLDDIEVILLDDCSTDSSKEILFQYCNHPKTTHVIFNEVNSGSTFMQWEKGIKLARGEYIWIAESDDTSDLKFLEKVIKPLEEDPEITISYSQSHRINSLGEVTGSWIDHTSDFAINIFMDSFVMDGNSFIENFLIHKNVIPNVSAVVFRRRNLKKILPLVFKPFMKYNADWFYYIQLACNSKIAFNHERLNFFRYHKDSVIAGAHRESGSVNVFEMELKGRRHALSYLKFCGTGNYEGIKEQARLENLQLKNLIVKICWERKNLIRLIRFISIHPTMLERILRRSWAKLLK